MKAIIARDLQFSNISFWFILVNAICMYICIYIYFYFCVILVKSLAKIDSRMETDASLILPPQ